eukprot:scaffold5440_cov109-Cylindrotheca_fusiformis.AAC.3
MSGRGRGGRSGRGGRGRTSGRFRSDQSGNCCTSTLGAANLAVAASTTTSEYSDVTFHEEMP